MALNSREVVAQACVSVEADLRAALQALSAGGIGIALALDDAGRLVGTVADGDIRRALLDGATLDDPVSAVMSRSFFCVQAEGNHRAHAVELMVANRVKQVPVVDGEGHVVGVHLIEEYLEPDPLPNWAVILAGGRGTRLRPITEQIPKPMVPVAGRPILERLVQAVVGAGVRRVFLAVHYKKEIIKAHFGGGERHGCAIGYLEEERPLGTGGPLATLPSPPAHPLLVLNGDLVGDFRFREMIEHHTLAGNALTLGVGLHGYEVPFGVASVEGGRVTGFEEKPSHTWVINQGVYVVSPELLAFVKEGVEYPITDLIATALRRDLPVGAFELEGEWHDVGRPQDLRRARGKDVSR